MSWQSKLKLTDLKIWQLRWSVFFALGAGVGLSVASAALFEAGKIIACGVNNQLLEPVAQHQCAGWGEAAFLLALGVLIFGVTYWLANNAIKTYFTRAKLISQNAPMGESNVSAVVIPVSTLKEPFDTLNALSDVRAFLSAIEDANPFERACKGMELAGGRELKDFSWQTNFATLDQFTQESRYRVLKRVHLVPTNETVKVVGKDAGSDKAYYSHLAEMLKCLLDRFMRSLKVQNEPPRIEIVEFSKWQEDRKKDRNETDVANDFTIITHSPVDTHSFNNMQARLDEILGSERKIDDGKVCLDITGGPRTYTAVATLWAAQKDIIYSYVRRDAGGNPDAPFKIETFDVLIERSDTQGI